MRPVLPAVRPFRAGAVAWSPRLPRRWPPGRSASAPAASAWRTTAARGARGSTTLISALVGDVGAHIVAVFLLVAGVLLLTGASVASVLRATGDSVTTAGRAICARRPSRSAPR